MMYNKLILILLFLRDVAARRSLTVQKRIGLPPVHDAWVPTNVAFADVFETRL